MQFTEEQRQSGNPRIDSNFTKTGASSVPRDPHTLVHYRPYCNIAVVLGEGEYGAKLVKAGK